LFLSPVVVENMISHLLVATLCLYGASGQTVDPSGPSYLELYTMEGATGASITIEEYTHDLSDIGFDDLVKSVCGQGAWMMYNFHSYNNHHWQDTWTELFISASHSCHDLPVTRHGDVSSVRFAGTGDLQDETLNIYHGMDWSQGEEMFIRDEDWFGDYNNEATSLIITGQSPWTVYEHSYSGAAICLEPYDYGGAWTGAWNTWDIGMPNNAISSARKGCFAEKVLKFQPKQ
ncbi:unnamed protein product, partial [Meganyctiphanes norvegica]